MLPNPAKTSKLNKHYPQLKYFRLAGMLFCAVEIILNIITSDLFEQRKNGFSDRNPPVNIHSDNRFLEHGLFVTERLLPIYRAALQNAIGTGYDAIKFGRSIPVAHCIYIHPGAN